MNLEGIGLGLVTSKSICEELGGEIKVQSIEGIGSTFTFILDIKDFKIKSVIPQVRDTVYESHTEKIEK